MIRIKNLIKQFGTKTVLNDISLDIPTGKMTCIIGRSGEGKSVLLKQIIGLVKPTSGTIHIDTYLSLDGDYDHKKALMSCGYVFQFAALLDSLTVFENIAIQWLDRGESYQETRTRVLEKLQLVNLKEDILDLYPSEISGGMKKRVGLARTLMADPSIILYDEPTTGLDPITSRHVFDLMVAMQRKLPITSIVISHDLDILKYADYVALLYAGKICYWGPAQESFTTNNPYMYQFVRGLAEGPIQNDKAMII